MNMYIWRSVAVTINFRSAGIAFAVRANEEYGHEYPIDGDTLARLKFNN